jgi:choice-of-anchor A domain-containing protein
MQINRIAGGVVGLGLGMAGMANAQSQLGLYNVITKGRFDSSSDVEGKVVAYSLGYSSATFAQNLAGSGAQDINVAVQTGLFLGNPLNISYGSMYAPWSLFRTVNFNQSGAGLNTGASFDFNTVFNGITAESATYSGYTTTGGASWDSSRNVETLKVTKLGAGGAAVFNIGASDLNRANESLALNLNGLNPTAIIINVNASTFTGNSSDYWGLNQFQSLATKVLWNFYNATSVTLNGDWYGSVLAPNAALTSQSTITGSVGANSFSTQGEVHLAPWTGVPEASSLAAIGFAGLCVTWTLVRRRNETGGRTVSPRRLGALSQHS